MTVDELGQQTKQKHQEYSNFSDSEVGARVLSKYPEYRSQITSGTPSFMDKAALVGKVASVMAGPEIVSSPTQKIQSGLNTAGEKVAELGGRMGYPKMGALYGTEIQTLPDILGAATGIGTLETSPSALARGIRTTKSGFNKAYSVAKKSSGIDEDILPISRGFKAKFPENANVGEIPVPSVPPEEYPKNLPAFNNFVTTRIRAFGKALSPKEVDDYHWIASDALDKLKANDLGGSRIFAKLSKLKSQIESLRGEVAPAVKDVDKAYAVSKKLQIPVEIAKKIVAGASGVTLMKKLFK